MKRTSKRIIAITLAMVITLSLMVTGLSAVSAAVRVPYAPTGVSTQNSGTGFNITWRAAANATGYKVYYKTAESSWEIKYTSTNSVNLENLEYGTLYYIQVQSIGANGVNGGFAKVSSMTHVRPTRLISTAYNTNASITVGWEPADGANGYAIAKKRPTDKGYTYYYTSDTTFTDTKVEGGTIYYYQIRPYYTDGRSAAYGPWSNTKTLTTLYRPTVTNVNSTVENMNINWNKIYCAKSYQVAFKRSMDTAWNFRTTTSTYFNVKYPTQGAEYFIQVRPLSNNLAGQWSEVNSHEIKALEVPTITSIKSSLEDMTVDWNGVEGAKAYKIAFKRTTDTAWNYRTVTSTSYIINKPTQGATYTAKVCALYGAFESQYSDTITHNIEVLGVPSITNIDSTVEHMNIAWNEVDKATAYKVAFKRTTDTAWNYRTTTSTSFVVDKPTQGATYTVQVCSLYGNIESQYSKATAHVIETLGVPKISSIDSTIKWLSINWSEVESATSYKVAFKRSTDKDWNFRTTTSTSYVVNNPTKGATYYIQVQALCGTVAGNYTSVNTQVIPEKDPYEGLTYYEAGETVKVTHPAETELVWVVDEAAHDETKTEVKSVYHYRICQGPDCGAVGDGWTAEQIKEHDWKVHGIEPGTSIRPFGKPKSGYVNEPVDTILHVSEKGHYEVKVIKEEWEEDVTIAQSGWYKTVTHPAETTQAKVIDKAGYYYEEPVYEYVYKQLCWGCDADVGVMNNKETTTHMKEHHDKGEISGYRGVELKILSGTNTINVPETSHTESVITKQTYNELVFVLEK